RPAPARRPPTARTTPGGPAAPRYSNAPDVNTPAPTLASLSSGTVAPNDSAAAAASPTPRRICGRPPLDAPGRQAGQQLGQRVRELALGLDVGAALGARLVHDVDA